MRLIRIGELLHCHTPTRHSRSPFVRFPNSGGYAMTPRERWKTALAHREPDRVPVHDSPWRATLTRWRREGLPEEIPVHEYFG